jgi:hypothetical protein
MGKFSSFLAENNTTDNELDHIIHNFADSDLPTKVHSLKKSQKVSVLFNIAKLYPRQQACNDLCMGVALYRKSLQITERILDVISMKRQIRAMVSSRIYMYIWLTASFLCNYSKYRHSEFSEDGSPVNVLNSISIIALALLHSRNTDTAYQAQTNITVEQLYCLYESSGGVVSQG